MRPALSNPFPDTARLARAMQAAHEVYALHEQGTSTRAALDAFSGVVGRPVDTSDLDAAFGSVGAETFAKRMLLPPERVPSDLTETDMIALIERILAADGSEFELEFWLQCVARSSGNDRIAELVFWPDDYFGRRATPRPTSAAEIVAIAVEDAEGRIIALPDQS